MSLDIIQQKSLDSVKPCSLKRCISLLEVSNFAIFLFLSSYAKIIQSNIPFLFLKVSYDPLPDPYYANPPTPGSSKEP